MNRALRSSHALAGAVLALVALCAAASERFGVAIGSLSGSGWSSGAARIELRPGTGGDLGFDLRLAELVLPAPLRPLRGIRVSCENGRVDGHGPHCARGALILDYPAFGAQPLRAPLRLDALNGRLSVHAGPLKFGGGVVVLDADWRAGHWSLRLNAKGVALATLARVLVDGTLPVTLSAGRIDARIRLLGGDDLESGGFRATLTGVAFSDDSGLHAGEDVTLRVSGALDPAGGARAVVADASISGGEIFLDPVFIDAGRAPLKLHAEADWSPSVGRVAVERFTLVQDGIGAISGRMVTRGTDLESLHAELSTTDLAPLFKNYTAPWLAGAGLDHATVVGRVGATFDWLDGAASGAELRLDGAGITDPEGRLTLADVSGVLRWDARGAGRESRLRIGMGRLYRFALGATEIGARIRGREVELTRPALLPILDGALRIDELRAHDVGADAFGYVLSGELSPVSLERVTGALNWPRFGGTLGGVIPRLTYAGGMLRVDGDMRVRVFDGEVTLRDLRLARPFGVAPRFEGDAEIHGLSLEKLTDTFSFGRILGRLDGRVSGLVLEDWLPSAFDAELATPENDDSRHRISQRAVGNLARIGGAGGMISSVFLGLFSEFSYARLGLRCRLRAGVCRMGGVGPAKQGFYIVEGGGMPPRIDVVGYNRQVDWETLIRRLQTITGTQGPVVR